MSRVGKKPITIPKGVDVQVAGSIVTVKGPKGSVVTPILAGVSVEKKDGFLNLVRGGEEKKDKALHGLNRALLQNAVLGVTGVDNQKVCQTATEIRGIRPPDPYKLKGFRFVGEILKKKAGKATGK